MSAVVSEPEEIARRDRLVDQVFRAALGGFDLAALYLGERLGLYRALEADGPLTSATLATGEGLNERFVREWLEQQAVSGILDVEGADLGPTERRYRLPAAHAEVLLHPESLAHSAPLARGVVASMLMLPLLLEAYRTGEGVPRERYGEDMREAQAAGNRPIFMALLGAEWLPAVPDVHARLLAEPPARVADVACGAGWSTIAMAKAYPTAVVEGFDLDAASVSLARRNAADSGLADRITFAVRDAADPSAAGRYDLVTVFEALHDMTRPVEALAAMRAMLAPGGSVLVVDERVAETFTAPGDDVERFMYGWSIINCLATGMTEPGAAGTGTVLRPSTMEGYAREAGFGSFEILPIEHETFRFYRLQP